MRLLVLATSLDRPEAALFAGLQKLGVQVHVVAQPLPEHARTLEEAGIPITRFAFRHRFDMKGMRLVRTLVRTHSFDIVYALSNRALSSAMIGLFFHPVKIVTYRGTVGHISWFDPSSWFTYLNPRISKIFCVSQAVETYLLTRGIAANRLTTVYKGHDIRWYHASTRPSRAAFGIPEDAFVVGCTAMMRAVKGIDDLLKGVSLLLSDMPTLHLLLIGTIKDPAIARQVAAFPDPSRIHAIGFRSDATELATLADVAVMMSKSREGFPKSVIEAMSQGVPAIVTSVGGMPELVAGGAAGILVPPENPEALAAAIRRMYDDNELRKKLGIAAKARIADAFNIQDTIKQVHATLQEIA